jgi:hypothetical protein
LERLLKSKIFSHGFTRINTDYLEFVHSEMSFGDQDDGRSYDDSLIVEQVRQTQKANSLSG